MTVAELEERLREQGQYVSLDGSVLPAVAAQIIGCTEGTLRNWRSQEIGPDYFKKVRIWYRLEDLVEWMAERHVRIAK